ncbi:MAG: dodecin family protein [Gemmatimonadota bacterium]|jgi:flavin-binding protein dodecin|nr:dodecin family protein [Gemmatimonadota bacterium]
MSQVFKSLELVGTSSESFEEAVRTAVKRAGETIRDLQWMEVMEQRGYIKGGEVNEYQVKVRVWFGLEDSPG